MWFWNWIAKHVNKATTKKRRKAKAHVGSGASFKLPTLVEPMGDPFEPLYPEVMANMVQTETKRLASRLGVEQRVLYQPPGTEARVAVAARFIHENNAYMVAPPVNRYIAAQYAANSSVLATVVRAYVDNLFGNGFRVVREKDAKGGVNQALLESFFGATETAGEQGTKESLVLQQFKLWLTDTESVGVGYLEIVMDDKGKLPTTIKHLPAVTVRDVVNPEREYPVYIQMDMAGNTVYFKDARDELDYDSTSGKVATRDSGKRLAHPVICLRVRDALGMHEGRPRWWGERYKLEAYQSGDVSTAMWYKQGLVLSGILSLLGMEFEKKGVDDIDKWFADKAQGLQNHHAVLVLEGAAEDGVQPRIKYDKLAPDNPQIVALEAQEKIKDAIRYCWRMSRLVLGQETNINKATAITLRQTDEEQAFGPDRLTVQALINEYIVKPLLGGKGEKQSGYSIVIDSMALTANADKVDTAKTLSETLAATMNDIRAKAGLPLLEDDTLGNMMPWMAQLLLSPSGASPSAAAVNDFLRRNGEIDE